MTTELFFNQLNGVGCMCQQQPAQLRGLADLQIAFNTQPDTPTKWSCNDWMFWHQELVKAFMGGKFASGIRYSQSEAIRLANQVFMQWWNKVADGFFDSRQFCGYGSDFLSYFKSVGLTDHISFIAGIITPVTGGAATIVDNVVDTGTSVTEAAKSTGKTLQWVVPALLIAAVGGLGYYAYKNYIKGNKTLKLGPLSGTKMSKYDAYKEAKEIGVDFSKDFHSQSFGNELAELAKATGYRKPKSASGSTGRYFFYHLQKKYEP